MRYSVFTVERKIIKEDRDVLQEVWNQNKDDARFCANCGEKLVIPSQQQAKQQPAQPKQQIYTEPQNEPKRSSKAGSLL